MALYGINICSMKEEILAAMSDHRQLERLYRAQKGRFKKAFNDLYPDIRGADIADIWYERLNFEAEEINWGTTKELVYIIMAALLAALIAKVPLIFGISEEYFFQRNIGFVVLPVLTAYFAWKNNMPPARIAITIVFSLAALLFINLLPDVKQSDTLILSCIHVVLFLWSLLGFSYIAGNPADKRGRMGYLKYNGDLIVMTVLILIAGGIMTGLTIGLFSLIGLQIEKFYFQYIVVSGLAAAPVLGTYLTQTNPQLVGKVAPVIAKLFSPLVFVMLFIYLIAIAYSGQDPYNNRDFLLMFNGLLIGVMAIIFFSIAESGTEIKNSFNNWILFLLSVLTIVVNGVALSAIIFRISEWGITPNRAAVLGGNILILVNLLLVAWQLYRVTVKKGSATEVANVIAAYLPVYVIWTIVITFVFPFLFKFR
jgi:hypothetical protein